MKSLLTLIAFANLQTFSWIFHEIFTTFSSRNFFLSPSSHNARTSTEPTCTDNVYANAIHKRMRKNCKSENERAGKNTKINFWMIAIAYPDIFPALFLVLFIINQFWLFVFVTFPLFSFKVFGSVSRDTLQLAKPWHRNKAMRYY